MSATQCVAKLRMRAVAAALVTMTFNFIGTGLGPLTVSIASDVLSPRLGPSALYAALWIAAVTSLGAAIAFALGSRYLRADVERRPTD
jgi:hypothetical protein